MGMINYKALLASLPFDINAEVLAGGLLENNDELTDSGQIQIRPLGHINRAGGREVMNVTGSAFNTEGKELVYIDINRESLFDSLPEMLFIQQEGNYEDEVEKAQHLARQEEMARRFFLPFEESFYRTRIDLEQAERSAIRELTTFLLDIYGLKNEKEAGNQEQMLSLALVLPFINRIVGDLELTSSLLTALLRKKVKITPQKPVQMPIPEEQQTCIGNGLLGVDLMLGNTFSDGIRSLQVAISDVLPVEVEDWLPKGSQRCLLEEQFFSYVLAAGEQAEISIEINESEGYFSLGDSDNEALNILGYTTKIN